MKRIASRKSKLKVTRKQVATLTSEESRSKPEDQAAWLAEIVASSDDAIIGKNLFGIVTSWNRELKVTASFQSGA